jgi:hypothetical protein
MSTSAVSSTFVVVMEVVTSAGSKTHRSWCGSSTA